MQSQSESFLAFLRTAGFVLFPGAMGTELQRRGFKSTLPLWSAAANLDAPALVEQIHAEYFDAGADIAITNTFRTTPRTFRKLGRESEAERALKTAVGIALRAKENTRRGVFVGGSFAPLEDCYRPDLVPSEDELRKEHMQQARWLAEAGVDFLLPETVNSCLEGQIMAEAASAAGLPFIISFVTGCDARLLCGTPLAEAVQKTDLPGRAGVSLNCRPIDAIDSVFQNLSSSYEGVIGLYPNGPAILTGIWAGALKRGAMEFRSLPPSRCGGRMRARKSLAGAAVRRLPISARFIGNCKAAPGGAPRLRPLPGGLRRARGLQDQARPQLRRT